MKPISPLRKLLEVSAVVAAVGCLIACSRSSSSAAPGGPVATASTPTEGAPTEAAHKEVAVKGGSSARRAVKDATDPDASKIDTTPKDTTVEEIQAQKPPKDLTGRQGPFETSTWRVKATVESVTFMKDHDYYLVLKGQGGGSTVVEVPDPELCKGSPLLPAISEARKRIEQRYHPTSTTKTVHDQVTVTGVGFLGWGSSRKASGKRGATGRQGARLMPGTGIDFGDGKSGQ